MATHQQSIYCAPLLRLHFSSPVFVPHYYGHTWAVQLCRTITATLEQSNCATLLWPRIGSPVIVRHYYGHTPAVQLQSSALLTAHLRYSHHAPLLGPRWLHSQAPNIMATHHSTCALVLWPHIGSPASASRSFDRTSKIQSWCSPSVVPLAVQSGYRHYGHTLSVQS